MTEVSETLGLNVTWRPFSLAILNENESGGSHAEWHLRSLALGRVLSVVERDLGNEAVAQLYTELGERIHHQSRSDIEQLLSEAIEAAGLPSLLTQISDDEAQVAEGLLRASTEAGIAAVGPGVGIPIIAINGKAFFGPVVSPRPKGEDALNLWNALYFATQTPGFYELKRGREVGPDFS